MERLGVSDRAKYTSANGIRGMFEKAKHYENTIDMSLGEPGFNTPKHVTEVAISNLRDGKTSYASNAGNAEFRKAISEKLARENDIETDPDKNIIVTAGATQGLYLTMSTLVNPGEEVILPDPVWPDYLGQIEMVHGKPVYADVNEGNRFKMTADVIEPLITDKTKIIIVNSPSNPTGAILNEGELRDIADLAEKYNVYIISDEPYEKIIYDGNEHFSIGSIHKTSDRVITVNSLSKTFAMTGWRVGYVAANEEIISKMIKLNEYVIASINEAFQLAGITALENTDSEIQQMVDYYDKNRTTFVNGINKVKGFSCLTPLGAFYAFPNIKEFGMSSEEVADLLLEKAGIITSPGSAFGQNGEGYLRISFANDKASVEEAVKRLQEVFGTKD